MRRLSLRAKTLFLVAATTMGLVAALYLPLRALLMSSFLKLEHETALRNLGRAIHAIEDDVTQVHTTCRDYAVWDETYAFLGGEPGSESYVEVNLVDETFSQNRLSLLALVDARGEIVHSKGYDLVAGKPRAAPRLPLSGAGDPLLPLDPTAPDAKGIVQTEHGPMMIAAHPVLTSRRTGPARGTLIMGRVLDDAEIQRLGAAISLSVSISPWPGAGGAGVGPDRPRIVRPLDEDRIAAYGLVSDVRGAPLLITLVEMPREIYQRGILGARSLAVAVAVAGIVFGLTILLLLERVVLRRVARLSRDVRRISKAADHSLRVHVDGRDELGSLSVGINGMLADLETAREVLRATFGRYVSEDVARTILAGPEGAKLGGETRDVTILFLDLRRYSTISERLPPAEVVDLLNEYFGAMSEIIEDDWGCVIEFLGDGLLAVFGAPQDLPDHAERAVHAALAIHEREAELNRAWERSGKARLWQERGIGEVASRIGLHAGQVIVGNLGSKSRMKYAVIGDAVNVAARIEALNDRLETDLLFSEEVRSRLGKAFAERIEDRGEHPVKGREAPVHVYTIA